MMVSSRLGFVLPWVVLGACAPAEVRQVEPTPVVAREGFALPVAVGSRPLPSAFVGVVVTPDGIEGLEGSGRPLTTILDDLGGVTTTRHPVIDELYDYVEAARAADGSLDVVWFIDARVPGKIVASVLYTGKRMGLEPLLLATGSATAPTLVEVSTASLAEPAGVLPTRFAADLELYVGPVSVTAIAAPRGRDEPPNGSAIDGYPRARPLELTADGSCRFSDAKLHELGATLCELQERPIGLRWIVDVDTPYSRVLERLVDDPRPTRCVGGRLMLDYSEDNPPRCDEAILLRDVLSHFAYEARTRGQESDAFDQSLGSP